MAIVAVTSETPGAGKTGIAAAIARHYAYLGRPVTLVRLAGDGNAEADAAYFGSLAFAPGSAIAPQSAAAVKEPIGDGIVVVEGAPADVAALAGASVVVVGRGKRPAAPAGTAPKAVIATAVATTAVQQSQAADGTPLAIDLAEDRTLAGFAVSEAKAMLNADVLVEGDAGDPTCDYLVIAPISSDAGQPYFRRFGSKAVVVRFDRTDMHLAALKGDPECLILTGGRRPSDYLFDAAGAQGIPVLLSRTDTENTVIALERIFDRTRFQGERKLERMAELLEATPLFATLGV